MLCLSSLDTVFVLVKDISRFTFMYATVIRPQGVASLSGLETLITTLLLVLVLEKVVFICVCDLEIAKMHYAKLYKQKKRVYMRTKK